MLQKKRIRVFAVFLLAILGFAVYSRAGQGEFIWDDEYLVEKNPYVTGREGARGIFSGDIGAGTGRLYRFYRPVQILSYRIDNLIRGPRPGAYHLTGVTLHVLTGIALFFFVNALYRKELLSFLTACFFLVHPAASGVACYISSRADSLYLFFLFLSFISYIKAVPGRGPGFILPPALFFALSLLSKEGALILPFLILLYHYTFGIKIKRAPFLALTATALAYITLRLTVFGYMLEGMPVRGGWLERVPGFFAALFGYFRILIFPFGLHMEYGNGLFGFSDPRVIAGAAIFAVLAAVIAKTAAKRNVVFFSLSWFLIALLPVSNLYPVNAYMAESWLYLPSAGLFLLAARYIAALYGKKNRRALAAGIAVFLIVFFSVLSIRQCGYWKDPLLFFKRTVRLAPDSARARNRLGLEYLKAGLAEKAIENYREAVRIEPGFARGYYNMALAYTRAGKNEEALSCYRKALSIDPAFAGAYNNLGALYDDMGMSGNAVAFLKKAIRIDPEYADAYNNLGAVYEGRGEYGRAEALYKKALLLKPGHAPARENLSRLEGKTGFHGRPAGDK